jgi:cation:H+ antiporter
MSLFVNAVFLLIGFVVLIKGADWMVNGASSLARRYRISELVIGLTIVAFGTSAPEMVVNVFASADGLSGVIYGNIIGSNIFNLLLILGVAGLIHPLKVQAQTVSKEIPFSLLAVVLLLILVNDIWLGGAQNILSGLDAFLLTLGFCAFLYYIYLNLKKEKQQETDEHPAPLWRTLVLISVGLAGLVIGGKLVVDNAVQIAEVLGWSQKLIGLTIVAGGTSLPELATSVVAALKRNSDIAVGNVIGSNIFNIFLILGISGMIRPIPYENVLNLDQFLLIAATILLFLFMFTSGRHRVDRWEAAIFLLLYIGYMVYLLSRN